MASHLAAEVDKKYHKHKVCDILYVYIYNDEDTKWKEKN